MKRITSIALGAAFAALILIPAARSISASQSSASAQQWPTPTCQPNDPSCTNTAH